MFGSHGTNGLHAPNLVAMGCEHEQEKSKSKNYLVEYLVSTTRLILKFAKKSLVMVTFEFTAYYEPFFTHCSKIKMDC